MAGAEQRRCSVATPHECIWARRLAVPCAGVFALESWSRGGAVSQRQEYQYFGRPRPGARPAPPGAPHRPAPPAWPCRAPRAAACALPLPGWYVDRQRPLGAVCGPVGSGGAAAAGAGAGGSMESALENRGAPQNETKGLASGSESEVSRAPRHGSHSVESETTAARPLHFRSFSEHNSCRGRSSSSARHCIAAPLSS